MKRKKFKPENFLIRPDKSIKLGPSTACDGGLEDDEIHHIISHAHTDHFSKTKIEETWMEKERPVIVTDATSKLLTAYKINTTFNHGRVVIQEYGKPYSYEDGTEITLLDSNHILGSAQVQVEKDGIRYGYSGDFGENIDDFIDVDYLAIDATYAGHYVEKIWDRETGLERLADSIKENLNKGPVNLIAVSGLIQEILAEIGESNFWGDSKLIIGTQQIQKFSKVYNDYNYPQPEMYIKDGLNEEKIKVQEIRNTDRYLELATSRKQLKSQPRGVTYHVKNRNINFEEPIVEDKNEPNYFHVALSSHAFSDDIFDYINNVSPKEVMTDSSRSETTARVMAKKINEQFSGIKAYPSL